MDLTSQKIDRSDIIFITPTIGTKWIFYQQYLLNKFFTKSKKILIDGNRRWDFDKGLDCIWYDFIKVALEHKSDHKFFVHIDEDCFITNPDGILELIERLEKGEADLIGPADYFDKIRNGNPEVINSFFMIGRIDSLASVMSSFNVNLKFKNLKVPHYTEVGEDIVEIEPYYNFFWNYIQKGLSIKNVDHKFNNELRCTSLLNRQGNSFALHMWFTRKWYSKDIFLGVTMYERYKRVEHYLNEKFEISFFLVFKESRKLKDIIAIQYTRIVPKNLFRVKRVLKKMVSS